MGNWHITATQDENAWLEDYLRDIIAHEQPPLPERTQRLGEVEVIWYPWDPGTAQIQAFGGTAGDRLLAETMVMAQLVGHGYKRASHSLYLDPATPHEDDEDEGGIIMRRAG